MIFEFRLNVIVRRTLYNRHAQMYFLRYHPKIGPHFIYSFLKSINIDYPKLPMLVSDIRTGYRLQDLQHSQKLHHLIKIESLSQ